MEGVALRFKKEKDYLLHLADDTTDKTVVHTMAFEDKTVSGIGAF
jgi:hypothetical protein